MSYETEAQQVEAIKRWWKENGKMVVAGVVLALAGVIGGRLWLDRVETRAQAASMEYQQLLGELSAGNREAVIQRGSYLVDNYASTPYASLAALALAKMRAEAGEYPAARSRLEWVLERAEPSQYRTVARLRLARIHLAEGNAQLALNTLAEVTDRAFEAVLEELRGDVYVAMGNRAAARTAYRKALEASAPGSDTRVLQMKLDDLGDADAS